MGKEHILRIAWASYLRMQAISKLSVWKENVMSDAINNSVLSRAVSDGSDFTNFRICENGAVETVIPKRNAVIIDWYDDCDDEGNPYMKRVVSIECKDEHLKEFLLEQARKLLHG